MRFFSKRILKTLLSVVIVTSIIVTVAVYVVTSNEEYLKAVKDSANSLRGSYNSFTGNTDTPAVAPNHDAEELDDILGRLYEPFYDLSLIHI